MAPEPSPLPPGTLAVVALPIGNPSDLTARAAAVLGVCDWVAAEDTRTVGRMLAEAGLACRLISYHDWNERERAPALVAALRRGERGAVVSEAGTPGISDPGYDVVRLARESAIPVTPVPGACALTAFLSASGLPTDRFIFLGFPPKKPGRREALFADYAERPETLVFYESPHRVVAALGQAREVLGNRLCAVAREMTKPHEEFLFGPLEDVLGELASRARVRGEICWGVAGAVGRAQPCSPEHIEKVAAELAGAGLPPKQAARELARRCGIGAKEAYTIMRQTRGSAAP